MTGGDHITPTLDSTVAPMFALFINGGILYPGCSRSHVNGHATQEIRDAHQLLGPPPGVGIASTLFALALIADRIHADRNLAGPDRHGDFSTSPVPWLRRLLTRAIAIVPAVAVIGLFGRQDDGPG